MDDQKISDRLRLLKDEHGWTAQEMADAIGISRRTLESYMRRENAALPGLQPLALIAKHLGVSLDWLAGVGVEARLRDILLARVAAERASLPVLSNLIKTMEQGRPAPEAEFLATEIGSQAAQIADLMHEKVVTSVQMARLTKQFVTDAEGILLQRNAALRAEIERLTIELGPQAGSAE